MASTPPPAPADAAPAAPESQPIASTSAVPVHVKPVIPEGMSKNAYKRLLKQQAFDAAKPARRAKERQMKKDKQKEKRKLVDLGLVEKPQTKKREKQRPFGARVVVDCSFDDLMTEKEVKSMTAQLAFCYASNRSSSRPFDMMVTGLSGRMKEKLDGTPRKPHLSWKGVEWWEAGYEGLWAEAGSDPTAAASTSDTATSTSDTASLSTTDSAPSTSVSSSSLSPTRTSKSSIIYLTGDSSNVLQTLEPGTTYILGGIVDRNRYKRLCLEKAEREGVAHAQLPIGEFLGEMKTRKVLTVNQVYDILLQYASTQSWKASLEAVMPIRKFETDGRKGRTARERAEAGEGDEGEEGSDEEGEEEREEEAMLEDEAAAEGGGEKEVAA